MKRFTFVVTLIFICSALQAQKYLRYTMKDGSFNGFYSECVDSILHGLEDGIQKSFVFSSGMKYSIPADNILSVEMENAIPNIDDYGEYRLYELTCDDERIKKIYVDNRATLCASTSGEFGANDTILVASVYSGIEMLIITDSEGRFKKLFVDDVLLWFDYDVEYGANVVLQTKEGYTEIPVETFTYDSRKRVSGISTISKIANFFKTNKAITAFLKTPRGKLPNYVEHTLSNAIGLFTKMATILAEVDNNPELRNQCVLLDVLSIGGDAAGIIAALAAEPVSGGTSTIAITILCADLLVNIDALYNHLFPNDSQMEVYRDYYKRKYGINIVTLPATNITCTDATLNGSITSLKDLKGQLYFSVEPISKTIISNGNKVSDGLWTFNSSINELEPGNWYRYYAGYRIKVDGLELIYSGDEQTFMALVPVATTGECTDVGLNSAIVSCTYENVPEDGICGVEYTWNDGSVSKNIGRVNGMQDISIISLKPNTTYTYCAFVEAYGHTYYGEDKTFTTDNVSCSVTLSDFVVTKANYQVDGFENEGLKYDYRFDASVKATLNTEDVSLIQEWGYVYEDPNGKKVEIPLSGFGTEFTDSRYAYFRNTPHSTARLYGYAYIVGSDNPIYGESHDFPLDYIDNKTPVATTGDCSNVTSNSATVTCTYENVPDGAACGVDLIWDNGEGYMRKNIGNVNGTQSISFTGLKFGKTYTYYAFIEDNGQEYYGEDMFFETDPIDLSGVWKCTIHYDDGSVETSAFVFTDDGKVYYSSDSSYVPEGEIGAWSVNEDGTVSVSFSWVYSTSYNTIYYSENFSGNLNTLSNPSSIEGTVYRGYYGISEHGYTLKFEMSRQ